MTRRVRRRVAVALGLAWTCCAFGDAPSTAPAVFTVHIQGQPLDNALQEFARQTNIQILFFSRLTNGRFAAALDGPYTVDEGMIALLSGSKLTYQWINPKTIQIVPLGTAHR